MRVAVSMYFQTGTLGFRPGLFFVEILHILSVPHFFRHGEIGLLSFFYDVGKKFLKIVQSIDRCIQPNTEMEIKIPTKYFHLYFSLFLCQ